MGGGGETTQIKTSGNRERVGVGVREGGERDGGREEEMRKREGDGDGGGGREKKIRRAERGRLNQSNCMATRGKLLVGQELGKPSSLATV